MLSFTDAVRLACSRIFQFQGRSRRSEFWWTELAATILSFILAFIPFIGNACSTVIGFLLIPLVFRRLHDTGRSGWWYGVHLIMSVVYSIYLAVQVGITAFTGNVSPYELNQVLLPVFTSPVTIILTLAGLVYSIVLLVFFVQDSQRGENKYGDSPKYPTITTGAPF